jgi:hypothetical protein
MGRITAVCGLTCNDCIAYVAAKRNDNSLREKAIEAWSTDTERLKLEEIDCDGCQTGGRLYKFCSICEVRKCALERGLANCGHCAEYPCQKLEKLWKGFRTVSGEEAKATLDNQRRPTL